MRRDRFEAILCLVLAVSLAGCAALLDRMRQHTYPPSFDYISDDQLHSVMWQMARDSKQIDRLVHAPGGPTPDQRDEIVRLLGFMLEASKRLGDERTNHPVVDEHRDVFQADLDAARRGVQSEPPNYTLAENVAGACVHCHEHSTR
jgi:cytochrome c553